MKTEFTESELEGIYETLVDYYRAGAPFDSALREICEFNKFDFSACYAALDRHQEEKERAEMEETN